MNTKTATIHATSTSAGAVTFTFPSVTMGQWWNVAATVPTAPATARFTLKLNGSPRFSWAGPQPSAALVAPAGSQISVVGTGLSHSTAYTALLSGGWTTGTPTGVPPAGPSSFALTQITGPVTAEITGPVSITGTVSTDVLNQPTVNLASTTKVIIKQTGTLTVEGVAGGTAIGIAGNVDITSGTVDIATVSGPVSVENVTNGVLQTGDSLEFFGNFTSNTTTSSVINITGAPFVYGAIVVECRPTLNSKVPLCATVISTPGTGALKGRFTASFQPISKTGTTVTTWQAVVPVATRPTARITITTYYSTTSGKVAFSFYGLTSNPGVQMRADGRTYPMGVFMGGTEYASGASHNIIAAPAAPRRIMLRSLFVSAGVTTAAWKLLKVNATVRGTVQPLAWINYGPGQPGQVSLGWDEGLLLDPATTVTITVPSGTYDALPTAAAVFDEYV